MKGYSLIEIMLSLFLTSILLSTLLHYYFLCQQQYFLAQKSLEEGLELHAVSRFMQDSIRRAGFTPCLCLDNLSSFDSRSQKPLKAMQLSENYLKISRMSEIFYKAKLLNSTTLKLASVNSWPFNFPILIADCYHAEVSLVHSARPSTEGIELSLASPLHYEYTEPFYVGEWIEEAFFVEKKSLYYQTSHKEKLSILIKAIFVERGPKSIHLILKRDEKKILNFDTRFRSC